MRFTRLVVALAVLSLATPAFAASKTVTLFTPASVNGTMLKAGDYKVSWDEAGKVTFAKGKKVIAEANGKIVETTQAVNHTTVIKKSDTAAIISIQFENSKQQLVLNQTQTASSEAGK
jgi:hypothetical protein